jgi:hypothetical protein
MENNRNLNINGGPNHPSGLFINPDLINENNYLKEQLFGFQSSMQDLQSSMQYYMGWCKYYQMENTELKEKLGDAQAQIINLEERKQAREEEIKRLTRKNSIKIDELHRTLKNSIKKQEGIMNYFKQIPEITNPLENNLLYKITNISRSSLSSANEKLSYIDVLKNGINKDLEKKI